MRRFTDMFLHDLPGALPTDHTRDWIPGGYLGTAATIARMKEFVTEYKRNFEIRKLAARIIAPCNPKDYYCYAKALYEFCRDRIKYAYDPHMVELVESPLKVLEAGIADCDSVCTLLASLNESIGLKTRFRTVKADSKRPDDFSHVYCIVRVPESRFSTTRTSGWIAEDATLPDKTFGWEPAGGQLAHKDWEASKDKDGEEEPGVGGDGDVVIVTERMKPMTETQAQLEIDQLTNALNGKLVAVLRKGIEYSNPDKAQMIIYGVSSVTRNAVLPTSPTQKLGAVRNGYNYWSGVIEQTHGSMPDLVGAPMMSGYAPMGDSGGVSGIWDWLTGQSGVATDTMTAQQTAVSRMNAYIAQIGDRLTRLKNGGAAAYYPAQLQKISDYYDSMRQVATYGDSDALKRESQVLAIYKPAVSLATEVANGMDNMGKLDQSEAIKTVKVQSWWDEAKETIKNVVGVGAAGKAPETYPQQAAITKQAPTPETTQSYDVTNPYTPVVTPGAEESLMPGGGAAKPAVTTTSDWLKKNGVLLGIGAAVLVGAYLYMKKNAAPPVAANPRRKKHGRRRK